MAIFLTNYEIGIEESKDVLPVYIGDDRTDEDAFKVRLNPDNTILNQGFKGAGPPPLPLIIIK